MKDHIIKKTEFNYVPPVDRIWTTDVLYCLRKAFWRRTDPVEKDFKTLYNFFRGNLFDHELTGIFPLNQVRIEHIVEDPDYGDFLITGKADFIDEGIVWELKTVKSTYYFGSDGANDAHKRQVKFYASCLGQTTAGIIYLDMGDSVQYIYKEDDWTPIVRELEDRARLLRKCLIEDTMPEPDGRQPDTGGKSQCDYCEFEERCK